MSHPRLWRWEGALTSLLLLGLAAAVFRGYLSPTLLVSWQQLMSLCG